jgi:hypothetical protein
MLKKSDNISNLVLFLRNNDIRLINKEYFDSRWACNVETFYSFPSCGLWLAIYILSMCPALKKPCFFLEGGRYKVIECPFYTVLAKNNGFLPTNSHLTHQLKTKNWKIGEASNPSLPFWFEASYVLNKRKKSHRPVCQNPSTPNPPKITARMPELENSAKVPAWAPLIHPKSCPSVPN